MAVLYSAFPCRIHAQSASHIITPPGLCRSTYILFLNLHSGVNSPNSCRLYALRILLSTIQAHLMTGTQLNYLGGVKYMARDRKSPITLS